MAARKGNYEVANIFEEMADMLEIQGANAFRVRAYRNAARTLQSMGESVADMVSQGEDLSQLPGIGKDLSQKIVEIVQTGKSRDVEELSKEISPSLRSLMNLPALGPKRVAALHKTLGIENLQDLKQAVEKGEVENLSGFGKKTTTRILEEIQHLEKAGPERVLRSSVDEIVRSLLDHLKACPGLSKATVAGSFRRQRETLGDLDILVTGTDTEAIMDHFLEFPAVAKVLVHGSTKTSVDLDSGLQVDVRAVSEESFGSALHYFTGSKSHNIAVRRLALSKGYKINEYGVYEGDRQIAGATEEEVYRAVGLSYIEPELRENRGEIEAAQKGLLPQDLIEEKDIRGDLHMHTIATDGRGTPEEMAEAAIKRGYEYIAITDHTKATRVAGGLTDEETLAHIAAIDELNKHLHGELVILKSSEVDILEDGQLDLSDEVLAQLDLAVCSIHSKFNLSREKQTERILNAMDNPYFTILGHPSGRLIGKRRPYEVDMEAVLKKAKEVGCFVELNSQPLRMDLNEVYAKMAKDIGVKVSLSSDSHTAESLRYIKYGVGQARRGWLEKNDVINTKSLAQLKKLIKLRRT